MGSKLIEIIDLVSVSKGLKILITYKRTYKRTYKQRKFNSPILVIVTNSNRGTHVTT